MAKCPKCGEEIDGLRNVQSGSNVYDCWAEERKDKDGKTYFDLDYQHDDFNTDGNVNVWNCPECHEALFDNEDAALEFLKPTPKVISECGEAKLSGPAMKAYIKEHFPPGSQLDLGSPRELPSVQLKTKMITFDDRLQQVRVLGKNKDGSISHTIPIQFLNYNDDDGFYYVKKYRKDWASIINI